MNCLRRHTCWQTRNFKKWDLEKGTQEESSRVKEPRRTALPVSNFMAMELVSWLSLVNHSDTRSFLVVLTLLSQDGFHWAGFWEVSRTYGWHFLYPFDPSQILLVGGSLLIPRSSVTSCCKITLASGYYFAWPGWAVLVSIPPNTCILSKFNYHLLFF